MTDYVIDENVVLNAVHGKKASNNKLENADTEKIFLYKFFSNKDKQFMNLKIQTISSIYDQMLPRGHLYVQH